MPRDDAARADTPFSRRLARLRRWPWGAISVVALLVLSAAWAIDPIRDAATLGPVPEATLHRPAGYLLLAPISDILDTLTLLSARQHVALLLTLIIGWLVWWWWRLPELDVAITPARRVVRVAARIGIALATLVLIYLAALVLPRPMAGLDTAGPDLIAIDFHSHTKYSHDGRPDWTPEDVREWHRNAGFDVAYVSDHRTFEGAREGWANNPTTSGEATLLLPAIEVVWRGEHVNILDADRMYRGILDATLRDVDDAALRLASMVPQNEPVLIETIPGDLTKTVPAKGNGTAGVRAIELVDGAPRGLSQGRQQRARIVALADSANLALVAGSDHHGWGHTASAWTLMLLRGWRADAPEDVSKLISTAIRAGGRGTTKVVERYVADTESGVALPFTVPLVAWGMFRTLSLDERVVWVAWIAALSLLMYLRRMRLRRRGDH
ncbi:MAG TPA: hypothetical protein VGP25_04605 [Gemmatimonadaceae bacterium]|nr:hypothetical protein [Gemmatimonadaceae bacterium]